MGKKCTWFIFLIRALFLFQETRKQHFLIPIWRLFLSFNLPVFVVLLCCCVHMKGTFVGSSFQILLPVFRSRSHNFIQMLKFIKSIINLHKGNQKVVKNNLRTNLRTTKLSLSPLADKAFCEECN